jgi:hypothetical protein
MMGHRPKKLHVSSKMQLMAVKARVFAATTCSL